MLVSEALALKHWLYLNMCVHIYVCIQMCTYTHIFIQTPVLLAMALMAAVRTLSDICFLYAFE